MNPFPLTIFSDFFPFQKTERTTWIQSVSDWVEKKGTLRLPLLETFFFFIYIYQENWGHWKIGKMTPYSCFTKFFVYIYIQILFSIQGSLNTKCSTCLKKSIHYFSKKIVFRFFFKYQVDKKYLITRTRDFFICYFYYWKLR